MKARGEEEGKTASNLLNKFLQMDGKTETVSRAYINIERKCKAGKIFGSCQNSCTHRY